MQNNKAICSYKSDSLQCENPIWKEDGSFCIFHSELKDEKKKDFAIEFQNFLKKIKDAPNETNDIDGFIFPENIKITEIKPEFNFAIIRCKFYGDFEIDNCEFLSNFRFRENIILGNVSFSWSYFHKLFIFSKNDVKGNLTYHIDFSYGTTSIRKSSIAGYVLIRLSYFSGEVEIVDTDVRDAWYIYGIDFSNTTRTRFRNLDFTNAYFFESKLLDIDFIDIIWRIEKNRYIISDESVLVTKKLPCIHPIDNIQKLNQKESIVKSLYLQLCANYDNCRLFDISGRFYISAMEMQRRSQKNWFKRNIFSWEAWYKYISLYGQSSNRAFWAILFVLLISSIIITFDPNISPSFNYSVNTFNHEALIIIFKTIFNSIKYNLYCLIHPAEWTMGDNISLISFVTAWERIIIILLGTFFLLALRRKFRRS